jgi:glycogen debranching enzyme
MESLVKSGAEGLEPEAVPAVPQGLQPFLHDAATAVHAPALAISHPDGQINGGVDGFFYGDRRILSRLEVRCGDVPMVPVQSTLPAPDATSFRAVLRGLGERTADPAVTLHRSRKVHPDRLEETIELTNAGSDHVQVELTVTAGSDFAAMDDVKAGRHVAPQDAMPTPDGLAWQSGTTSARLASTPAPDRIEPGSGLMHHQVRLGPGSSWTCTLVCTPEDTAPMPFVAVGPDRVPWQQPALTSADRRFDRLLRQSVADAERLLLADAAEPTDVFLAAGAPWFLTLFGRDSLWATRMLLPLGTSLAAGTLRTLARRQGTRSDTDTGEEPGKILHEVRRDTLVLSARTSLPPVYYGTVDATALWVVLLHDAWRWGMDPAEVRDLLPHAEAGLRWMAEYGDADGDGLLEYIDHSGRGLVNQGWKDSGDSIRWRDGTLATAPVALSEVQAYAYQAARGGAALLRAFDRPGADRWEEWADTLRTRFRERFWVEDEAGPYCAAALDADKRPVDAVTSSLGQLLGTGLLDQEESAWLNARIAGPELDAGFGLRTLSTASGGYNPLGYHIGSIWPHDTAIAVHGLVTAGFPETAASLTDGIVAASEAFDARLPELFAGYGSATNAAPAPYPASCRPQAWSAAASVLMLRSVLGLEADVPNGTLSVAPLAARGYLPLRVEGLRVAGHPLSVAVDATGEVHVETTAGLSVRVAESTGVDSEAPRKA